MITESKHVRLQFGTDGQAWIVVDDGDGHQGMINLNNLVLGLVETDIIKPTAINALAAALQEAKQTRKDDDYRIDEAITILSPVLPGEVEEVVGALETARNYCDEHIHGYDYHIYTVLVNTVDMAADLIERLEREKQQAERNDK